MIESKEGFSKLEKKKKTNFILGKIKKKKFKQHQSKPKPP